MPIYGQAIIFYLLHTAAFKWNVTLEEGLPQCFSIRCENDQCNCTGKFRTSIIGVARGYRPPWSSWALGHLKNTEVLISVTALGFSHYLVHVSMSINRYHFSKIDQH